MAIMEKVDVWKANLDKALHEKNGINDLLEKVEQKTGVRRLYLVLGVLTVLSVWLLVGYGSQFLCNFLGFIYPAYASVKAIESHQKEDDTKWLTYWVVYSVFALVEFFSDIFLFWIPFYWFLKCCFLVWCMIPLQCNGSHMIYYRIIRPIVLRHQGQVDKALDSAAEFVDQASDAARDAAKEAAADAARHQFMADSSKQD